MEFLMGIQLYEIYTIQLLVIFSYVNLKMDFFGSYYIRKCHKNHLVPLTTDVFVGWSSLLIPQAYVLVFFFLAPQSSPWVSILKGTNDLDDLGVTQITLETAIEKGEKHDRPRSKTKKHALDLAFFVGNVWFSSRIYYLIFLMSISKKKLMSKV